MINWEERIAQLFNWINTVEENGYDDIDEETATIIHRIVDELESTLSDNSEKAEDKRKKLFASLRVIAETNLASSWPQRRGMD
jgi:molecular chaperone DnaK (HSP70)|tara:strand:+ start:374 stop:622 length:249 start_codon:yes stop_codon:yes gene_type:complete